MVNDGSALKMTNDLTKKTRKGLAYTDPTKKMYVLDVNCITGIADKFNTVASKATVTGSAHTNLSSHPENMYLYNKY